MAIPFPGDHQPNSPDRLASNHTVAIGTESQNPLFRVRTRVMICSLDEHGRILSLNDEAPQVLALFTTSDNPDDNTPDSTDSANHNGNKNNIIGTVLSDLSPALAEIAERTLTTQHEVHTCISLKQTNKQVCVSASCLPIGSPHTPETHILFVSTDISLNTKPLPCRTNTSNNSNIHDPLRSIAEHTPDIIYRYSLRPIPKLDYLNPATTALLGYTPEDYYADPWLVFRTLHPDDWLHVSKAMASITGSQAVPSPQNFTLRLVCKDGNILWTEHHVCLQTNRTGVITAVEGIARDVTEPHRHREELEHNALHDMLTGLPNRRLFLEHLTHALTRLRRRPSWVALLFLDLDGFKTVNDTLGHAAGDRLLTDTANRLQSVVRPDDTVARIGGDEFTVLMEGIEGPEDARYAAERLRRALTSSFEAAGEECTTTVSIGIALTTDPEDSPEELLRKADLAMYDAKQRGRNQVGIFDARLRSSVSHQREKKRSLRRAWEQREFTVRYQPVVKVHNGEICAVEATVLWAPPGDKVEKAEAFLNLAEETGLIVPIANWTLEEACQQAQKWSSTWEGGKPIPMQINVSARQLAHTDFVKNLEKTLERTKIDPPSVCLELAETALMSDPETILAALRAAQNFGIRMSIDNFGLGYSSVHRLKQFPIDAVKIDISLISQLIEDGNAPLIEAVFDLSHALGSAVVVKNVRQPQHLRQLLQLKCDCVQGELVANPLPGQRFLPWLQQRQQHAPLTNNTSGSKADHLQQKKATGEHEEEKKPGWARLLLPSTLSVEDNGEDNGGDSLQQRNPETHSQNPENSLFSRKTALG